MRGPQLPSGPTCRTCGRPVRRVLDGWVHDDTLSPACRRLDGRTKARGRRARPPFDHRRKARA